MKPIRGCAKHVSLQKIITILFLTNEALQLRLATD